MLDIELKNVYRWEGRDEKVRALTYNIFSEVIKLTYFRSVPY